MGKDQEAIHRPSWTWCTSTLNHLLTSVLPELHQLGHTWKRRHSVLGIRKLEFKIQSCPRLSHFNSQSLISHHQNERSGLESMWLFCGRIWIFLHIGSAVLLMMDEPTILPTQAGHGKGVARPWEVQGSECWASGKESRSWDFKKVPTWERKAQTSGWLHLLPNKGRD